MTSDGGGAIDLNLDGWETSVLERSAEIVSAAVKTGGADVAKTAVVPVPHQCRPLGPNSRIARDRIAGYLDDVIAEAFASDPGPQPPREEGDQSDLMDAACRLCQGHCCKSGYEAHAHLGVEDIRRYRRRHPDAVPDEIKARYLDLLPETRTLGGCYFQGQMGCTLPRHLRSELCNTFVCRAQKLLARAEDAGAAAMVMVGTIQNWPAASAVWDDETGYRQVTPAPAETG